jgi:adenylate kinase
MFYVSCLMNLIILGPQGSGKGTQAEKIAEKFGLEHIDMGKFLREVAKMDTPLGKEVYEIQNVTKTLVPSRILEEVFTVKMNSMPREQGIVFDGFPRNIDQAQYFEKTLVEFGRLLNKVFFIKLTTEEAVKRISTRRVCEKCKKVFILGKNLENEAVPCSECGGKIIQRIDDTEEGIKKRLEVFEKETLPVINYYKEKGLLVEINGEQGIEEVFQEILSHISPYDIN